MRIAIILFSFQSALHSYDLHCRTCEDTASRQSFLNHALCLHGAFSHVCPFCATIHRKDKSKLLTNVRRHLKVAHPEWLLGFILHNCSINDEQLRNNIYSEWNPAYADKIYKETGIANQLFKTQVSCLLCEKNRKKTVLPALSAFFHAAAEHWPYENTLKECCQQSFSFQRKKDCLKHNFFAAMIHTKTCVPAALDQLMLKTFKDLMVTWENDILTLGFRPPITNQNAEITQSLKEIPNLVDKIIEDEIDQSDDALFEFDPSTRPLFDAPEMPRLNDYLDTEDFQVPRTNCSCCTDSHVFKRPQTVKRKRDSLSQESTASSINILEVETGSCLL
jgi:hypothetical protein